MIRIRVGFFAVPSHAAGLCLSLLAANLAAADVAPPEPPPIRVPPAVATANAGAPADAAVTTPPALLGFLVDHLYSQGAWAPGDVQIPYGPGITILLSELAGPEAAKALDLKTVPESLQENFRQAELRLGAKISASYLARLRALAAQLPPADRPLAAKLIDGMVAWQTAQYRPKRLLPATAPLNRGYRQDLAPAQPLQPVQQAQPVQPAVPAGPPETHGVPVLAPPPLTKQEREWQEESAEIRAERAANETWMNTLSTEELARVAACLASRRRDLNAVNFYDRTLRLFIGRAPLQLGDVFDAPVEFRRLEARADADWRQELSDRVWEWQQEVLSMRRIAAQEQVAKLPVEMRPGLLAVLKLQFDDIARQQLLQHQYQSDIQALAGNALPADQREALQKRASEYPATLRQQIETYGEALPEAWTDPLEQAFVDAAVRARRLELLRDSLHPRAKPFLEKLQTPAAAPNQGSPGNPDQF